MAHLMTYYEDLFSKGREIKFTVMRSSDSKLYFNTVIKDNELLEVINDFIKSNSVKENYSVVEKDDYKIQYQLRIPLFDEKDKGFGVFEFVEKFRKYLKKSPYNIDSKSVTKYKYEAILIF